MLHCIVRTCLPLVLLVIAPVAQALNENTTIVLHARDGFAPCDDPQQQGICVDRPPTLDLSGMQMPWVYVMLRNYDELLGVQCAFDWPSTWTYLGGEWHCLPGAIEARVPIAPGPITGTLIIAFNCISGGALAPVGRMIFGPPSGGGCLAIIESGWPFGNHVIECPFPHEGTPILPENWGRVCAGAGGYDACWPASTPVEPVTWGAIKGQYR